MAVAQVFSTSNSNPQRHFSKLAAAESAEATPGEGPIGGIDAYLAEQRAYPADDVPLAVAQQAAATFESIAKKDASSGDPGAKGRKWEQYGPLVNGTAARRARVLRHDEQHGEPDDGTRGVARLR